MEHRKTLNVPSSESEEYTAPVRRRPRHTSQYGEEASERSNKEMRQLRKFYMRGFTLIEMIVYIGLFSMIIGGAIVSAYNIFESTNRNQTEAMVAEEGIFLIGKINWALTGATAVDVLSTNKISITKFGIPASDNPLIFDISSGEMRLKRGANSPQVLNNTNITVNNLTFNHTVSSGDGIAVESVSASFTINAKTPEGLQFSEDFHIIKYIRK